MGDIISMEKERKIIIEERTGDDRILQDWMLEENAKMMYENQMATAYQDGFKLGKLEGNVIGLELEKITGLELGETFCLKLDILVYLKLNKLADLKNDLLRYYELCRIVGSKQRKIESLKCCKLVGVELGETVGLKLGKLVGIEQENLEVVQSMINKDISDKIISDIVGKDIKEIRKIKNKAESKTQAMATLDEEFSEKMLIALKEIDSDNRELQKSLLENDIKIMCKNELIIAYYDNKLEKFKLSKEESREERKLELIHNMINENMDYETISDIVGKDIKEIRKIKREMIK